MSQSIKLLIIFVCVVIGLQSCKTAQRRATVASLDQLTNDTTMHLHFNSIDSSLHAGKDTMIFRNSQSDSTVLLEFYENGVLSNKLWRGQNWNGFETYSPKGQLTWQGFQAEAVYWSEVVDYSSTFPYTPKSKRVNSQTEDSVWKNTTFEYFGWPFIGRERNMVNYNLKGKLHGPTYFYFRNGKLRGINIYREGKLLIAYYCNLKGDYKNYLIYLGNNRGRYGSYSDLSDSLRIESDSFIHSELFKLGKFEKPIEQLVEF